MRPAHKLQHLLLIAVALAPTGCRSSHAAERAGVPFHAVAGSFNPSSSTLTLAECLQVAREKQPGVQTQRAALAAAEDAMWALETLRLPATLKPELPLRRRQAALGVDAAAAGLVQAERDAAYGVVRLYVTVLFAREQERVARSVVERLAATLQVAKQALDAGARDVTAADVDRTSVYLRLAEARRTQAVQGTKRALAALKEAVGFAPSGALDVPEGRLPELATQPLRDEIVAAAVARRGEVVQASAFAQLAALEVDVQATSHRQQMATFAVGGDIHSRTVPHVVRNSEYRPGAVPPEMPVQLTGTRQERIKHAESLCARAAAAYETTRNLVGLEAEDAFLRWEEAAQAALQAREGATAGDKLADDLSKDFAAGLKVRVDEVVGARVLAAQARSQYNEFRYRQILALADLERATAGAFCAGVVEAIAANP